MGPFYLLGKAYWFNFCIIIQANIEYVTDDGAWNQGESEKKGEILNKRLPKDGKEVEVNVQ